MARKHSSPEPGLFAQPLVAAKTLTKVEVDAAASHQHEFHAGRLRLLLGFGEDTVKGALTFFFYLDDVTGPRIEDETFSLYDARKGKTHRGPEWHLYYHSSTLQELARPGDLLLIYRPDPAANDLHAIIARAGTQVEKSLRTALSINDLPSIQRFIGLVPSPKDEAAASTLAHALISRAPAEAPLDEVTSHPVYRAAIETQRIPDSRTMARVAHEIVRAMHGDELDPDAGLLRGLETETRLFFAIEEAIGERELKKLVSSGAGFSEFLAFAMGKHQSRRTRRGQSLQNHLEQIFIREGIRYEAQCTTEDGEKPDFIIPGGAEYHDASYPDERLRMVGCKSRVRDRWRQYLNEARRINPKFHVSLDESLSTDLLERMDNHALKLFMPARLIREHYASNPARPLIGTIAQLVAELRRVL